ncbi:hypothetical protein RI367_002035 [Sorochytrium milnesiophthora]
MDRSPVDIYVRTSLGKHTTAPAAALPWLPWVPLPQQSEPVQCHTTPADLDHPKEDEHPPQRRRRHARFCPKHRDVKSGTLYYSPCSLANRFTAEFLYLTALQDAETHLQRTHELLTERVHK